MTQLDAKISFLLDHPEYVPALVEGLIATWREPDTSENRGRRADRLNSHMNREHLPVALVAHDGTRPFGVVAVRKQDLEGWGHIGPWLGGLYVFPEARGRGLGSRLCRAAQSHAARLGISELYLFTLDQGSLYRRLGWQRIAEAKWSGRCGEVLRRDLHASAP
jgi:predicted N-acetyltransferase YhbS